jgi:hypothetical protein
LGDSPLHLSRRGRVRKYQYELIEKLNNNLFALTPPPGEVGRGFKNHHHGNGQKNRETKRLKIEAHHLDYRWAGFGISII